MRSCDTFMLQLERIELIFTTSHMVAEFSRIINASYFIDNLICSDVKRIKIKYC